jgi:hypothetical protein
LPGRPVTRPPVGSYPTISPLPDRTSPEIDAAWRCYFCGTFLRVAPTGCYPAPCSLEPGLSSNRFIESAVTRPPRPGIILRWELVKGAVGERVRAPVVLPFDMADYDIVAKTGKELLRPLVKRLQLQFFDPVSAIDLLDDQL